MTLVIDCLASCSERSFDPGLATYIAGLPCLKPPADADVCAAAREASIASRCVNLHFK